MFADIALPKRRYQVFTYLVPPRFRDRLQVGSRVLVPLGRSTAQGLVVQLSKRVPSHLGARGISKTELREIAGLIDSSEDTSLNSTMITLARQVTDYYLAPPASGLRLIIPPALPGQISKRVMLTDLGRQALQDHTLSPQQATILARLSKSPNGLTLPTLRKSLEDISPLLTRLKHKGWVVEQDRVRTLHTPGSQSLAQLVSEEYPQRVHGGQHKLERRPSQGNGLVLVKEEEDHSQKNGYSSEDLASWRDRVLSGLSSKQYDEFLVYDSGSFRQQHLLQIVSDTLNAQRAALILTPEINQASLLVQTLKNEFGERIGLFHGDLPQRIRSRRWHEIQEGRFGVVVGTRIALFVPVPSLGVVWVRHEESPSYKEEQMPSYHVREVARMRAKLESGILVLSSAHPSLETVHQFRGHPSKILATGISPRSAPEVRVINLQQTPYGALLSDEMINGMRKTLGANEAVILFLNRKGYSRALLCRDCGYVPQCSSCGVTLTVYKKPARLVCSYCGQTHLPPVICPSCRSTRIEPSGYGTERLEEIVEQQFPSAKIARFDRAAIKTSKEEAVVLECFKRGEIDILIGTELLFHTQAVPCARFVGIPFADGGLHLPDFRSAERTYRLLEQAIGLANPGQSLTELPEVVVQTFLPAHHVFQAVARRDPQIFYDQESSFREALGYPPYTHLIQMAISGGHQNRVVLAAKRCRDLLASEVEKQGVHHIKFHDGHNEGDNILGPIPSVRPRSRGTSRYMILIKTRHLDWSRQLVHAVREELDLALRRDRLTLEVNVDPIEIL